MNYGLPSNNLVEDHGLSSCGNTCLSIACTYGSCFIFTRCGGDNCFFQTTRVIDHSYSLLACISSFYTIYGCTSGNLGLSFWSYGWDWHQCYMLLWLKVDAA